MQLLINWLANVLAIDKSMVMALCVCSSLGALFLRSTLENPLAAFIFYPIIAIMSLLVQAMLITADLVDKADWFKCFLISGMCGNCLGVVVAIVLMGKLEEASERMATGAPAPTRPRGGRRAAQERRARIIAGR
jgi:hypothetical protein